MTLRIVRVQGGIRLSGEFRVGHLDQIKTEIERCESPVVFDLEELDLIDLEGVRFLNACEAKGMSILRREEGMEAKTSPQRHRVHTKSHKEEVSLVDLCVNFVPWW